jgi:uncharacterized membrane protein YhaH (DUF805 family)
MIFKMIVRFFSSFLNKSGYDELLDFWRYPLFNGIGRTYSRLIQGSNFISFGYVVSEKLSFILIFYYLITFWDN